MINANELRIGNMVLDGENIVKIECIESKFFNDYDGGNDYPIKFSDKDLNILMCDLSELKPIPITEEILLKCGFMITERFFEILLENKSKFNGTPRNCYITKIVIDLEMKLMWFTCVGGNSVCVNMPESLHLFQNLYFALTGQELNVDNLK